MEWGEDTFVNDVDGEVEEYEEYVVFRAWELQWRPRKDVVNVRCNHRKLFERPSNSRQFRAKPVYFTVKTPKLVESVACERGTRGIAPSATTTRSGAPHAYERKKEFPKQALAPAG